MKKKSNIYDPVICVAPAASASAIKAEIMKEKKKREKIYGKDFKGFAVGDCVEVVGANQWKEFQRREIVKGKIVRFNGGYIYVKIDNAPRGYPEIECYEVELRPLKKLPWRKIQRPHKASQIRKAIRDFLKAENFKKELKIAKKRLEEWKKNPEKHTGSSFDDMLKERDMCEDVTREINEKARKLEQRKKSKKDVKKPSRK